MTIHTAADNNGDHKRRFKSILPSRFVSGREVVASQQREILRDRPRIFREQSNWEFLGLGIPQKSVCVLHMMAQGLHGSP
jgi:hypothetical protein